MRPRSLENKILSRCNKPFVLQDKLSLIAIYFLYFFCARGVGEGFILKISIECIKVLITHFLNYGQKRASESKQIIDIQ